MLLQEYPAWLFQLCLSDVREGLHPDEHVESPFCVDGSVVVVDFDCWVGLVIRKRGIASSFNLDQQAKSKS